MFKRSKRNSAIRVIVISIYAILVPIIFKAIIRDDMMREEGFMPFLFLLLYVLFFNIASEGNIFFDRYLNKRISWYYFPRKRLLIQVLFTFLWSIIVVGTPFVIRYIIIGSLVYPMFSVITAIAIILFLITFNGIFMAINFFNEWQAAVLEAEKLKQEKLKADYRVLQNQVDPHFLFNSFNVLISEINYDPKRAEQFTRELSNVYRYVLQSKNYELISLEKEIAFIQSFVYLHQVRVGESLQFKMDIRKEDLKKLILPLTLQILVENAIKHNVMNKNEILKISINSLEDKVIVKNNLNPKKTLHSTQTGLSNIQNRYELLKNHGFRIEENKKEFIVHVPLIEE